MSDRYLYHENRWHGLQRTEIVRETPAYFFIKYGRDGEQKISKKHMRSGDGWDYTRYEIETSELKDRYEKQEAFKVMIDSFYKKLDELRKVIDPEIIKKVMDIDLQNSKG